MSDNVTPTKIKHYRIIRLLGRGGMGNVYLANDTRLDRDVAIKCIRHDLSDPSLSDRLRREAALLAKLNHPNVVQIYDIIDEPDQLALVMEYIEGTALNYIARETITPYSQKLLWLSEIAEGLAAAHEAGIIHRDLKAENILLTRKNTIKITDFGIAKNTQESFTQYGKVIGSYHTISPEQAMGLTVDYRSDLFSLGILAYQLLLGKHPFGSVSNEVALVQRIVNKPFTPIKKFKSNLPTDCIKLLEQLLAKKPNARPAETAFIAKQFHTFAEAMAKSIYNETHLNATVLRENDTLFAGNTAITHVKEAVTQYVHNIQQPSVLATVILLSAFSVGAFFWPELTKKDTQYIAVLPPAITANETVSAENQKLIAAAVYDALQQSIINIEGLELIPSEELEDTEGTPENIGRALGADEVISSSLQCENDRCDMALARLGGERWSVQKQKQFPVLTKYLIDISEATQKQLLALYPNHEASDKTIKAISDEDYREYVELVQLSGKTGAELIPVLERLDKLQTRIPKYQPIYHLYRSITLYLYTETKDKQHLEKFKQSLYLADRYFPENVEHQENWFRLHLTAKDYAQSEQVLHAMSRSDASTEMLEKLKALLLTKQGKYEEAITAFDKAKTLRPSAFLHYHLASTQWKNGSPTDAKKTLNHLFINSPNHYRGNRLLATIALTTGELTLAIEAYKKLLTTKPEAANYNNLGIAYSLQRDYKLAYEQYQRALRLAPNNYIYLTNLADAELLMGNVEQAQQLYQKILGLTSAANDLDSYFYSSQAYAHLGLYEKAIYALQQTQKLAPNNSSVIYNAALIYTLIGETTSALVQTQQALENGIGTIWFQFPWFDKLCQQPRFNELLTNAGAKPRCS